MRMWTWNRNRKTRPATLQEVRGTEERVEGEGGSEEYENGEPAGQSETTVVKEMLQYVEKTGRFNFV